MCTIQVALCLLISNTTPLHDLSGDEEADSDRGEEDDPRRDPHHHHRHRREEVEQGAALLPARRDGDPGHDAGIK